MAHQYWNIVYSLSKVLYLSLFVYNHCTMAQNWTKQAKKILFSVSKE